MKAAFLAWFFIAFLLSAGWVLNLVKLTNCDFKAPYKTEVMRSVGLIPPVGAVIGWLTFEDEKGE